MNSSSRIDLVFPPYAKLVSFPELGMPQLAAYLRRRKIPVRQWDLNLTFLQEDLLSRAHMRTMERALRETRRYSALLPEAGSARTELRKSLRSGNAKFFIASMMGSPQFDRVLVHSLVQLAESVFHLIPSREEYSIDGMCRLVARKNPVLETFYEKSLFACWSRETPPLIIGLSIGMATQVYPALLLARLVKRRFPKVKVAMGGPWVNQAREVMSAFMAGVPFVDYCCLYEGERPLGALHGMLMRRKKPSGIPGLFIREGSGIRHTPPSLPIPLDDLPPPDFSGLPLENYQDFVLPIQTTRNCHWGRCVFCYHRIHSAAEGFEERDPSTVAASMHKLREITGCRHYFLADSCTSQALIGTLADILIEHAADVRFSAMTRSTGRWTPRFAARTARAGLTNLYVGLESANPGQLEHLRKGITLEGLAYDLRNMSEAGIRVHLFVIDYPTQTGEEIARTIRWLSDHRPWIASIIPQKFELGRNTPVFQEPGLFKLDLPPDVDRRLDVFSLPFATKTHWGDEQFQDIVKAGVKIFDDRGRKTGEGARGPSVPAASQEGLLRAIGMRVHRVVTPRVQSREDTFDGSGTFPFPRCCLCGEQDLCARGGGRGKDYPRCHQPLLGASMLRVRDLFSWWKRFHRFSDPRLDTLGDVVVERFGRDRHIYSEVFEPSFSWDHRGVHLCRFSYGFPGFSANPDDAIRTFLALSAPFGSGLATWVRRLLEPAAHPCVAHPIFGLAYDGPDDWAVKLYLQFFDAVDDAPLDIVRGIAGVADIPRITAGRPLHMVGIDLGPGGITGVKLYVLHRSVPLEGAGAPFDGVGALSQLAATGVTELRDVLAIHRLVRPDDPGAAAPSMLDFSLPDNALTWRQIGTLPALRRLVKKRRTCTPPEKVFRVAVRRVSLSAGGMDKLNAYYVSTELGD